MINQDILVMYSFAPLVALMLYILVKMFSHFKW